MKQYTAFIILALCMMACGQHSKHLETLMQVESFMEERPDSALTVLQGIDIEDDEYGQMLMNYVQGCLQQEEEDYPASIISMFNAEKIAKKFGASDILGLIYYSLSNTYRFLPFIEAIICHTSDKNGDKYISQPYCLIEIS